MISGNDFSFRLEMRSGFEPQGCGTAVDAPRRKFLSFRRIIPNENNEREIITRIFRSNNNPL